MSVERTIKGIVAHEQFMNGARRRVAAGAAVASIVLSSFLVIPAGAGAAIWSIERPPAPVGATDTVLQAVSCTSPDACMAVAGPDQRPGITLAERWDGSRWTIQWTNRIPSRATVWRVVHRGNLLRGRLVDHRQRPKEAAGGVDDRPTLGPGPGPDKPAYSRVA